MWGAERDRVCVFCGWWFDAGDVRVQWALALTSLVSKN